MHVSMQIINLNSVLSDSEAIKKNIGVNVLKKESDVYLTPIKKC